MSKEEKDIGKIMEEMLNRPLELIEENKKLKKKIDKLQKENEKLKEENTILEGNKIGYKLAIQELEKTIDLIIDDFQMENYFVGMTNKEVREYYKKRKELKE